MICPLALSLLLVFLGNSFPFRGLIFSMCIYVCVHIYVCAVAHVWRSDAILCQCSKSAIHLLFCFVFDSLSLGLGLSN